MNNKVNWFLAKLHSIHVQKAGVRAGVLDLIEQKKAKFI